MNDVKSGAFVGSARFSGISSDLARGRRLADAHAHLSADNADKSSPEELVRELLVENMKKSPTFLSTRLDIFFRFGNTFDDETIEIFARASGRDPEKLLFLLENGDLDKRMGKSWRDAIPKFSGEFFGSNAAVQLLKFCASRPAIGHLGDSLSESEKKMFVERAVFLDTRGEFVSRVLRWKIDSSREKMLTDVLVERDLDGEFLSNVVQRCFSLSAESIVSCVDALGELPKGGRYLEDIAAKFSRSVVAPFFGFAVAGRIGALASGDAEKMRGAEVLVKSLGEGAFQVKAGFSGLDRDAEKERSALAACFGRALDELSERLGTCGGKEAETILSSVARLASAMCENGWPEEIVSGVVSAAAGGAPEEEAGGPVL